MRFVLLIAAVLACGSIPAAQAGEPAYNGQLAVQSKLDLDAEEELRDLRTGPITAAPDPSQAVAKPVTAPRPAESLVRKLWSGLTRLWGGAWAGVTPRAPRPSS